MQHLLTFHLLVLKAKGGVVTMLKNLKMCPNIQFSETFKIAKLNF